MKTLTQNLGSAIPPDEERLIPIKEVAQRLSVSARTIYRLIASGQFPHPCRIGKKNLFRLSDVLAIMKAGAVS